MPRKITDLDQLTEHADVFLCDVWGVIHNGVNPFALSGEALKEARGRGQTVILITNSPRPAAGVLQQFGTIGVDPECWDDIVTSGDVTRQLVMDGPREIYFLGPVYRNREEGPLHSPEFTMLEWYRADRPYDDVIEDCAALAATAQSACGAEALRWRDATCDARLPYERLTVAEAFAQHTGLNLARLIDAPDTMADAARSIGIDVLDDDDWSDLFSRILVRMIEPKLGQGRFTILDRYPAREAALARPCVDDPRFAERFEVYACGVELANGFGELTDAKLLRERLQAEMDEKQRRHGERWPIDEDFLEALSIMPPASGCALGFDRLVMLATGAARIDDVIWTPAAGR